MVLPPDPVESEDFFSFTDYANLSIGAYSKKNTNMYEINNFLILESQITDKNFFEIDKPANLAISTFVDSIDGTFSYDVDVKTDMESTYNFRELEVKINTCEDYVEPPDNVIITKPNPPPYTPPVKKYTFSGLDPITKKITTWQSTLRNSKKPDGAEYDYIHVTLLTE